MVINAMRRFQNVVERYDVQESASEMQRLGNEGYFNVVASDQDELRTAFEQW